MEATDLKPVRVRVRQLDYVTKAINPLGDEVDKIATAYGPGSPQNHPDNYTNLDPESQEFADKQSDYKRGQLILVRPTAYIGLIESGAVRDVRTSQTTDDETGEVIEEEDVEEEEILDSDTATVEQLAEWIRSERPTVNDVVQASDGDPEVARKLLEAEGQATNGQPRRGVMEGLTSVISRG